MKMKSMYWVQGVLLVAMLLFLQGCGHTQLTPAGTLAGALAGAPVGTRAPVITHSYAIEQGRYGDILKLYIEAEDPDNDMIRIATVVDQVGYGLYYPDMIYLKPQYSGHFAGYLQWNTFSSKSGGLTEWTRITIKVSVLDKSGHESNVVVHPFQFASGVIKNPPPPSPFDQPNLPRLGHIFIDLVDPSRDNARRRFDD
jgi:hypothetical protein